MRKEAYVYKSVLAPEIQGYLALRESQGHRYAKERGYFKQLDQYLIARNAAEKTLTAQVIEGWLASLPADMSVNTKIVYASHYTQFAKYLTTLGISAFFPDRPIDDKSYTPYVFSENELTRLFAAADRLVNGGNGSGFANRDFPLILRILYGCGLRVNEALRLQVGDIDLKAGVLLIRNAKGNKDRLVPADRSLTDILDRYVSVYHRDYAKDALLFSNRKGKQHSDTILRFWFGRTLISADIEKPASIRYARNICPHCLRHTFAVKSLRKQDLTGIDMYAAEPFLSTYMGHTRIYGTQTYLHMTAENSEDVVEKTTAYTLGLFPEVPK